uniref:Retrovirus-related Pol polyprotein from transposon 297 n=1 Tax=Schistocephalus solidus TaxID=70667 RepID=A0A0V0JAJ5_SCHSO
MNIFNILLYFLTEYRSLVLPCPTMRWSPVGIPIIIFETFPYFSLDSRSLVLTLHPAKCVLGATSLEFLDHQIDSNGIRPLPSKVAAIWDFPPPSPTSKRQLQRLLDMVNFYHWFLQNCADTIPPLNGLLAGSKRTFELTTTAYASFEQAVPAFARQPITWLLTGWSSGFTAN